MLRQNFPYKNGIETQKQRKNTTKVWNLTKTSKR